MEKRLTLQHPLFEHIRAEHAKIRSMLQLLHTENRLQKVMELWVFAELHHHSKEETLLFSILANKPRVREGGPMCSYYFDSYLNDRAVENAEKIIGSPIILEMHQQKYYSENLPLRIPTDEHRAGKAILHHILTQAEKLSASEYESLLSLYERVQNIHLQKEETCFFHLCCSLLSEAEADAILRDWESK